MTKEPAARYASARELADDLRRYLQHLPIAARRVGPLGRLTRWCRRKPAVAATLAVSAAVILLIAGFSFQQVLSERDRFRQERDRAELNLYHALVGQASAEMRGKDTGWWWRAMEKIEEAARLPQRNRQELRDLATACMSSSDFCFRLHATWPAHREAVSCIAFSRDNRWVASASADRSVLVRRLSGKEQTHRLPHDAAVRSVAFHPSVPVVASGSSDGTIRFWRLTDDAPPTLAKLHKVPGRGVAALAFAPDGKHLAVSRRDGMISVFTLVVEPAPAIHELHVLTGHEQEPNSLSFSVNGKLLASCSVRERTLRIWDVVSGKPMAVYTTNDSPSAIAFSPVGRQLAWCAVENMGFGIFDLDAPPYQRGEPQKHSDNVTDIAWPSASNVLTASRDGTLRLWSTLDRALQAEARGDFAAVESVAASGDGRLIVAGHSDGTVRLWELTTPPQRAGARLEADAAFVGSTSCLVSIAHAYRYEGDAWKRSWYWPRLVVGLMPAPDGRTLTLARSDGAVEIWDLSERRLLRMARHAQTPLTCAAANGDKGCFALAAEGGVISISNPSQGKERVRIQPDLGSVHRLAWSPDGAALAAHGEYGLAVWDVTDSAKIRWQRSHVYRHRGAIAWTPGRLAVGLPGGKISICDDRTGKQLSEIPGHPTPVSDLAFSADGRQLSSAGADHTVRLWNVASGEQTSIFPVDKTPDCLAWSRDGRWLVVGNGSAEVWDMEQRKKIAVTSDTRDTCVAFAADGSRILLGNHGGSVRYLPTDELLAASRAPVGPQRIAKLDSLVPVGHISAVWGTAASPDGRWIATCGHDSLVQLWDGATFKRARTLRGHDGLVWNAAFSANSKFLASASRQIKIWDIPSGAERFEFASGKTLIRSVVFHPKKPWLFSAATDGSVRLWEVQDGRAMGTLHQFPGMVAKLAVDPSGRWLAAACADHHVALWDLDALEVAQGQLVGRAPEQLLKGHKHAVWAVTFSPDGRYLASGSVGGIVHLWDTASWSRLATFPLSDTQVRSVCFSPDSRFLAVAVFDARGSIIDLDAMRQRLRAMNLDW